MFRAPRYLEKTEYIQFNLDTPLTFPGNGQHQRKSGQKFFVKDRDNVYDWYNAFFRVNFKFEALADGANVAANTASAPINSAFSLIKSMTVKSAGRGDELLLTGTQINKMKKVVSERRGADLNMSKTQIEKTAQRGGNIFSSLLSLAKPLIKPAVKALASAGLSFGAEKALKKIFGNGYGPNEIKLYKLVQAMTPEQKKAVEKHLVEQGGVHGGGVRQYGGFLGMLASIGVPIAIDLISKMFGKGMQVKPAPRSRRSLPPPPKRGGGMHVRPPPFFGTWDDLKKR